MGIQTTKSKKQNNRFFFVFFSGFPRPRSGMTWWLWLEEWQDISCKIPSFHVSSNFTFCHPGAKPASPKRMRGER